MASTPLTKNALKARIKRRLVRGHADAKTYMRSRYDGRKIPLPKIIYIDADHKFCLNCDTGFAFAYDDNIYLRKELLEYSWPFIEELLLHEMAHVALNQVNNNTHDMEWKRCAMYIGATGADRYTFPRKDALRFFGVYTYTMRNRWPVKVIGLPLMAGEGCRREGFRMSKTIRANYSIHAVTEHAGGNAKIYINLCD